MFTIIDAQIGNLRNVEKAFQKLGYSAQISASPEDIQKALVLVLPGVGAFGKAMENLKKSGLKDALIKKISAGTPTLGICLGLQLFFEKSEESPGVKGLGLLKGKVKRFPKKTNLKIPQIGWNDLKIKKSDRTILAHLGEARPMFYFVHSYYAEPRKKEIIIGRTFYGLNFAAAVHQDNLWGVQFHPEKSGAVGLKILDNFARICLAKKGR